MLKQEIVISSEIKVIDSSLDKTGYGDLYYYYTGTDIPVFCQQKTIVYRGFGEGYFEGIVPTRIRFPQNTWDIDAR